MALSRKFLTALGIEAEKIDEIISAHTETVNALKEERDEFKANAEKAVALEKELTETKEQLEARGKDSYQVKYEAIKEEFEAFKSQQAEKEILTAKDKAYRQLLKEAGVSEKRIDAIVKVADIKSLEMDGDALKDADKLTESIKEEWADFITTETKGGVNTDAHASGGDGSKPVIPIPQIF